MRKSDRAGTDVLAAFLRRHRSVALDTCVFIYELEAHPKYLPLTIPLFDWIERSGRAVTSTLTMTEVLVKPYEAADEKRVDAFRGLLRKYPNLEWIGPDLEIADIAAQLRAKHRMRIPDAIQAATAIQSYVTGLVTNDSIFERVNGFETLVLDRLF